MEYSSVSILGTKVHLITMVELTEFVVEQIHKSQKCLISNHNLHSAYLFHKDKIFKKSYESAKLIHIDGMPLVLWGKFTGKKTKKSHRITYLDWIDPLFLRLDQNACKLYYLGSVDGVAQTAVSNLKKKYPHIQFKVHHGFFDVNGVENEIILNEIMEFCPDVLMVGMGMPRQEKWIINNLEKLPNCVILPCGACFDYIAGNVKTPPRWLGKFYLEWFYRFLFEPKRLFRRYFIEPILLLPHFFKDIFRI